MSQQNSLVVRCPNCGQLNRLNVPYSTARRPICSKCWTSLTEKSESVQPPKPPPSYSESTDQKNDPDSKSKNLKKRKSDKWLLFVGLSIVITVAYNIFNFDNYEPSTPTQSSPPQKSADPVNPKVTKSIVPDYPKLPLPFNGEIQYFSSKDPIAPLEIKSSSGGHYLVKLDNAYTNEKVLTVFVRGGATVTLDVPLGTYEFKYASGENWYGYKYLFGPKTSYNIADEKFSFRNKGYEVSGYTITLYKVADGNLNMHKIDASQF